MKKFGRLSTIWALIWAAASLVWGTNAAFAGGDFSVKIDSFTSVDPDHHLGEVCGTVTVSGDHAKTENGYIAATVIADPKSGNPGYYNTFANQQGTFCTLILTYTGTASATVWVPTGNRNATSEVAQIRKHR
jgi:hypothetical protein